MGPSPEDPRVGCGGSGVSCAQEGTRPGHTGTPRACNTSPDHSSRFRFTLPAEMNLQPRLSYDGEVSDIVIESEGQTVKYMVKSRAMMEVDIPVIRALLPSVLFGDAPCDVKEVYKNLDDRLCPIYQASWALPHGGSACIFLARGECGEWRVGEQVSMAGDRHSVVPPDFANGVVWGHRPESTEQAVPLFVPTLRLSLSETEVHDAIYKLSAIGVSLSNTILPPPHTFGCR